MSTSNRTPPWRPDRESASNVADTARILPVLSRHPPVKREPQAPAALRPSPAGEAGRVARLVYRPNYFYGGYAVHGMTSVPAYPASDGCVRMTVPTMDRMWSSVWIGMPVAIYSS